MKLDADALPAQNAFTAYGAGYVEVNRKRYTHSIIVLPEAPVIAWPVSSFAALTPAHFALLAQIAVDNVTELLLFGSGAQLRFAPPSLTAPLVSKQTAIETMDCHAACRTYNLLLTEGRKVAAALLIETV